ncbi:MAG TPA: hypothetical protein VJG90_04505 [Candidatus Nanoarchaeia archaeon]|nr:hypothetical protein [Candidatus Nanoarchaeia archaeon]
MVNLGKETCLNRDTLLQLHHGVDYTTPLRGVAIEAITIYQHRSTAYFQTPPNVPSTQLAEALGLPPAKVVIGNFYFYDISLIRQAATDPSSPAAQFGLEDRVLMIQSSQKRAGL